MIAYAKITSVKKLKEYADKENKSIPERKETYFSKRTASREERDTFVAAKDILENSVHFDEFLSLLSHLDEINQKPELFYRDANIAVVGYNTKKYILPSEFVRTLPLTDYEEVSACVLAGINAGTGGEYTELPVSGEASVTSLSNTKYEIKKEIALLEKEKEDIQNGAHEELASLRKEMEAVMAKMEEKKRILTEQMQKKQEELNEKKRHLEKEIRILETQIYGIRCYTGEVVNFCRITSGKPAPDEDPVVIYQKIRYLDEELGKCVSLYNFGAREQDKDTFLSILKNRKDIAEFFAPGNKSVSVLKTSRTGVVKGASDTIANTLEEYDLYHENQLAVLIRNGENLSVAWLDSDKIQLNEDNLFYNPAAKTETETVEEESLSRFERDAKEKAYIREENKNRREILSRWFFFNILQGILDNGEMLRIPEKVNITNGKSKYIVFSLAENRLTDDRYGTFEDILNKSKNIPLRKGDEILTVMNIRRDDSYDAGYGDRRWNNNRGIGERNRTSGLRIEGNRFLPINKVLSDICLKITFETYRCSLLKNENGTAWYSMPSGGESTYKTEGGKFLRYEPSYTLKTDEKACGEPNTKTITLRADVWTSYAANQKNLTKEMLMRIATGRTDSAPYYLQETGGTPVKRYVYDICDGYKYAYDENKELFKDVVKDAEIIGEEASHYYISLEQSSWNSDGTYRVNFEIKDGEFIPPVFLCSSWLKYVILTGKTGNIVLCGAKMEYANLLKYLNRLLAYTQEREEKERRLLMDAGGEAFLNSHTDWDAIITEWRIKNNCHALTATRAKRFLKEQTKSEREKSK